MTSGFKDRTDGGRALAEAMKGFAGRPDMIVLALPRGGVPVAYEVAKALDAELDLMLVRKLGTPGQQELALGAIASGGILVLNNDIVRALNISRPTIDTIADEERIELRRREQAYRGDRPTAKLSNRCVILVDDGLATGATMRAAVAAVKQQQPAYLVVAVPVAPPETAEVLRTEVDEFICLLTPSDFAAVGKWYQQFLQTSDDEVRKLLALAWQRTP